MVMCFTDDNHLEAVTLREGAEALTRVFGKDAPAVAALLFKVAAGDASTPEMVLSIANGVREEIEKATRPVEAPAKKSTGGGVPGCYY